MLYDDNRTALDHAGVPEPFGYYFAELPARTDFADVEAVAFWSAGEALGSVSYSKSVISRGNPLSAADVRTW